MRSEKLDRAEDEAGYLDAAQELTEEWRDETINGETTAATQAAHTAVEAAEVLDLIVKDETYEGRWAFEEVEHMEELATELGDVYVAHLGTLSELDVRASEAHNATGTCCGEDPMDAAVDLMAKATSLAKVARSRYVSVERADLAALSERHAVLRDAVGVGLEECVDLALEKNGARDWADHQEGSS